MAKIRPRPLTDADYAEIQSQIRENAKLLTDLETACKAGCQLSDWLPVLGKVQQDLLDLKSTYFPDKP